MTTEAPDRRALHARAVRDCDALVQRIGRADLDRPTPCAGWTLRDLVAHLIVQDHGFAAAAQGRGCDPTVWEPGPPPADPVAAHAGAVDRVLAAYAAEDVLDRLVDLPEISTERQFTGAQALGFHTVDHVVHAWDVARSLGRTYTLPDELARPRCGWPGRCRAARPGPDRERHSPRNCPSRPIRTR